MWRIKRTENNVLSILTLLNMDVRVGLWRKLSAEELMLLNCGAGRLFETHGLQHSSPPCTSPTPRECSNSCPLSQWHHPTISFSVVPFSSHLQSFPESGSFTMSWFLTSGDQNIWASASASILPLNIQDWFPLGLTGWLSLQSKGLSRVFFNTTVQKHQFFVSQLPL